MEGRRHTVSNNNLGAFNRSFIGCHSYSASTVIYCELAGRNKLARDFDRDKTVIYRQGAQCKGFRTIAIAVEEREGLREVLANGFLSVKNHITILVENQLPGGIKHWLIQLQLLGAKVYD